MTEQAAGAVASAVIGGVTDRALTTAFRKLRSQSRPAAVHEKLQQLETLVLKLRCAVEVSEKHAIGSASLLEWRDRLREAAAEGGAVVLDFQRRARAREDGESASATSTSAGAGVPGELQPAGALYFTRSALGGMAQRVRDAARRLFSTDEDTTKLDSALEKLERLSPDITQFLMALQLEVSRPPRAKRSRVAVALEVAQPTRDSCNLEMEVEVEAGPKQRDVLLRKRRRPPKHRSRKAVASSSTAAPLASAADAAREDQEMEARMLAGVLERTLQRLEIHYVKRADDRDTGGLEWLAEWASVIREAMERGEAVLQTLRSGSDVAHKAGGALEEDGELYSFVRAVQRLALEDACFAVLVELCPWKQ